MDVHTRAAHAGQSEIDRTGAHVPLIDLSSTYPTPDLGAAIESLAAFAGGAATAVNPVYSRLHNPTVHVFERGVAELEGAEAAVAFASGMAAVTACLLAVHQGGARHVVGIRPIYGGTDHLLSCQLTGLDITWTEPEHAASAVCADTGLVIVETPANPTMRLTDIRALCDAVAPVPVVVDSTFATPILQRPLDCGAAMSLHSATKFLGGHGDAVGGVVATSEAWAARLRQVRIATGGILHPFAAFLLHRGLKTLPLRVEAAQRGAEVLARRLREHQAVSRVSWPGFDPKLAQLGHQMSGPGSLIAFEITGGREEVARMLEALQLITPAVSLGSTDTLIQHPAGLTHQIVSEEGRKAGGISESLLRLSVGIEHPEDLWADLKRGLDRIVARRAGGSYPRAVA